MPVIPSERAQEVRDQLLGAAERRRQLSSSSEALSDEIRQLVRDARAVSIPVAEVARLLEIDRSTLYRVYSDAA
jgi:DNA invertase Pin-like site-specific DNA recombinase